MKPECEYFIISLVIKYKYSIITAPESVFFNFFCVCENN